MKQNSKFFGPTPQTRAPKYFHWSRLGTEWRVKHAQTRERGPPSAPAEISVHFNLSHLFSGKSFLPEKFFDRHIFFAINFWPQHFFAAKFIWVCKCFCTTKAFVATSSFYQQNGTTYWPYFSVERSKQKYNVKNIIRTVQPGL